MTLLLLQTRLHSVETNTDCYALKKCFDNLPWKKNWSTFFLFSGCVHQYLCLVPQDRKYCNALTSVIMFESARWVTDFSALKAARAFEAIEKYAANLINQPWRKEFKEIKVRKFILSSQLIFWFYQKLVQKNW